MISFKGLLNIAKTLADKLDELYSKCISRGSQTDSAELSDNLFSGRIPEMVSQAAQASDDFQETGLLIDSFAKGQEDIMIKLKDESQNISKEVGSLVRLSSHPRQNTINNNLMKAIKKVNDGLENLKNLADLAAKENCKNNGDIDEIIKKTEANVVKRLSGSISRKNIDKEVAPTLHRLLKTKQRRPVQSIVRQWEKVIPNKQLKVDSNLQVLPEDKNYKTKSRSVYLGKRCGPSTNRTKYASLPGRLNKPGVPIEELIRAGRRSY
ncbi:MAG: hypothetical protein BGO76_02035 [Caedibacter sp. 38-128]|nr:hypothetical protein [Holosporales bacterium]OJX08520.1 MAG: hypothetical protein BGO76_02035 [Caedibacter sp. 38-128]